MSNTNTIVSSLASGQTINVQHTYFYRSQSQVFRVGWMWSLYWKILHTISKYTSTLILTFLSFLLFRTFGTVFVEIQQTLVDAAVGERTFRYLIRFVQII